MSEIHTPRMAIEELLMQKFKFDKGQCFDIASKIEMVLEPWLILDENRTTAPHLLRDRIDVLDRRMEEETSDRERYETLLGQFDYRLKVLEKHHDDRQPWFSKIDHHLTDPMTGILTRLQALEKVPEPCAPDGGHAQAKPRPLKYEGEVMTVRSSHWKHSGESDDLNFAISIVDALYRKDGIAAVRVTTIADDPDMELLYLKRKVEA